MCAVDAMHLHSEPPVEDHSYKIKQFYKDNRLDIIQSTQPVHSLVIFLMQTYLNKYSALTLSLFCTIWRNTSLYKKIEDCKSFNDM